MAKTQVLRGQIIFKEASLVENLTNRILSIASDGTVTDRPALSSSGFVTSALPSAQILVGNGSGVATAVAMTGVISITNAGVTSIVDNSIVNADINSSAAIAYSKLNLAGGVVNADVSNSAAIAYSKLALTGSIVNADVAVGAAIARTKIASGTAYKIVVNGVAGALGEATITPSRAIVSDANGLPTAATTTATQIGYLSTLTGAVQAQLDTQIAGHTTAALLQSPTASENGFAITWNDGSQEWELTDPVIQGIPTGGATGTVLMKDSGTDYDASWTSLTLSDVSDVTADVDDVNLLTGLYAAGVTSAEITFLAGTTSAIQPQINLKLDKALTENYLFIGNSSNVAIPFAPGPDTYQLTSVGGVPTWTAPSSGGTVTSVQVAGGTTGLTFSGGPVTTSGTITMAGTLDADNGGTGQSSYTVGDILYASTTSALSKLAAGTSAYVLTSNGAGVAPSWQAAASSGHVIENSGTPLTARANLNFKNGLTAADNSPDTDAKLGGVLTEHTIFTGGFDFEIGTSGSNVATVNVYSSSQVTFQAFNNLLLVATSDQIILNPGTSNRVNNSTSPPVSHTDTDCSYLYAKDISSSSELFVMNEAGIETQVSANTVSAPSTSVGAAIVNYYGSSATNFLGTPVAWMSKKIGATTYKIPLYT